MPDRQRGAVADTRGILVKRYVSGTCFRSPTLERGSHATNLCNGGNQSPNISVINRRTTPTPSRCPSGLRKKVFLKKTEAERMWVLDRIKPYQRLNSADGKKCSFLTVRWNDW